MSNLITGGYFTETSALNYCLRAIGEAPVVSAATATQADCVMALATLNDVLTEVLSMQWAFNSEFGFQLQPVGQINWTPSVGPATVEVLNVFAVPANLMAYRATPAPQQVGVNYTDIGWRRALVWNVGSVYPLVFYDRDLNREGWNAGSFPFLALDCMWLMPFIDLPYEAQLYVVAKSARQLVERSVNSSEIAGFIKTDEAWAYARLMRRYGKLDSYNMLRTGNAYRALGSRPASNIGWIDIRGKAPATTEVIA
jgi:hypothetical protein